MGARCLSAIAMTHPAICRHCQYYEADRRWAGECQLLQVTVGSDWPACRSGSQLFSESATALPPLTALPTPITPDEDWMMQSGYCQLKVAGA